MRRIDRYDMNENIERIIEETEAFDLSIYYNEAIEKCGKEAVDALPTGEELLIRFANSIVEECANVCRQSSNRQAGNFAEDIEKHFEIK